MSARSLSYENKIKLLTAKVEELERDVKRATARALEAERECGEHVRIGDGYWDRMRAAESKITAVRGVLRDGTLTRARIEQAIGIHDVEPVAKAEAGAKGPRGHRGAFGWRGDETLMQAYQRVCLELESARELLVLLWRERAALPSGLVEQIRPWTTSSPAPQTFEQAWALKEAEGYQYGEDALEQVRMGWEMAKGKI
jgi:hypothetical protein